MSESHLKPAAVRRYESKVQNVRGDAERVVGGENERPVLWVLGASACFVVGAGAVPKSHGRHKNFFRPIDREQPKSLSMRRDYKPPHNIGKRG